MPAADAMAHATIATAKAVVAAMPEAVKAVVVVMACEAKSVRTAGRSKAGVKVARLKAAAIAAQRAATKAVGKFEARTVGKVAMAHAATTAATLQPTTPKASPTTPPLQLKTKVPSPATTVKTNAVNAALAMTTVAATRLRKALRTSQYRTWPMKVPWRTAPMQRLQQKATTTLPLKAMKASSVHHASAAAATVTAVTAGSVAHVKRNPKKVKPPAVKRL